MRVQEWDCESDSVGGRMRVYGGGDSDENVFVSAGGSVKVLECLS